MATWPPSLPPPLASGYSLAPLNPVVRTDMESGAARVRRRTVARNDVITLSWLLSTSQMQTFRAWFDGEAAADAKGGADWFDLQVDTGGIVIATSCRFASIWRGERIDGGRWRVSAEVETR